MTRRDGIMAALAAGVGLMSGQAKTENNGWIETRDKNGTLTMPKGAITFALDGYTEFHFTCGQDSITLTPSEIMAALKQ